MIPVSQWPLKLAQNISDGALTSLCRLQELSGRGFSLISSDRKFLDFCVVVYLPQAPDPGSWPPWEATDWEWKEWRRPAPKKWLILSPSPRPLAPAGCGVWFPTAAAGSAAAPSLGGNLRGPWPEAPGRGSSPGVRLLGVAWGGLAAL